MSQRRSYSNSSFGSTQNPTTNSSSTPSSNNTSPSSSPHHHHNSRATDQSIEADCGQKGDKTIINICPFGHSPSTSNISPIPSPSSLSSSNNTSPVDDDNNRLRLSSPLPSPSKLNPKGGRPSRACRISLFCPLICSTRKHKSQQHVSPTNNSTNKKNSSSKNSTPQYSQAIQQVFSLSPSKSSQNTSSRQEEANVNGKNAIATTSTICCGCNCCTDSNKCEEKLQQQIAFSQRRRRRRNWKEGGNAGKINNGNGANNNNNGIWWRRNGKVKEVFWILLLQFAWIFPYLLFANYLERCLLPFRLHCYTDPDLLTLRRSPRQLPEFCAAQFFATNGEFRSPRRKEEMMSPSMSCPFNQTLAILLEPWRIRMDEPTLKRVIVIRSAPRSLEYREFIRSSWKSQVESMAGPVIFVTGQDGTELASESAQHGDILQLDFVDSYRNLSLKMVGIYRFFTERSEQIQQIVVINDDTIVNATALNQLFGKIENGGMQTIPADRRYLVGKVSRGYPRLVFPWLPWYVPARLYPHKCYPPFVQGSSFIISREAAVEVLCRVCDFPWRHIHLDDILMGIATNCLGIANLHADGFDVGHGLDQFIVYHYQFSRHSANKLVGMFNDIRHNL